MRKCAAKAQILLNAGFAIHPSPPILMRWPWIGRPLGYRGGLGRNSPRPAGGVDHRNPPESSVGSSPVSTRLRRCSDSALQPRIDSREHGPLRHGVSPHDPPTSMTLSHASAVWMVTFWRNRCRGGIGRSRGTGDVTRSGPEARMTSLRLRRALPRAEVRRVVVLDIDGLHTSHPVRQVRRGLAAAGIY